MEMVSGDLASVSPRPPVADLPAATLRRLPLYLRALLRVAEGPGVEFVSSSQLAELSGCSSDTVRRDLWILHVAGRRGVGYDTDELRAVLDAALRQDLSVRLAIVGAGKLGSALARYVNLGQQGFVVAAVFDRDPALIGQIRGGVEVRGTTDLAADLRRERIDIGLIATSAEGADEIAQDLVAAGVGGILNFAPVHLHVPDSVHVRHIDVVAELQILQHLSGLDR